MTAATEAALDQSLSVVDAIARFPAEGAVFTTFTLSLTWFERYLLPTLERSRARRILVLADPLGVAESTHERLARGPGVRYALDVAHAPGGVFHPKVAFLWAADSVLLAVGSGNLTFAGMQRNLEVWEVMIGGGPELPLARQLTREVAVGALGFIKKLADGTEADSRARKTLDEAGMALGSWLPRLTSSPDLVWLDTFSGPIAPQFVRSATSRGTPFKTLSVLAPFHDPTGGAVSDLAGEIGAARLEILFTGKESAFPFDRALPPGSPSVSTLRLVAGEARPLHAKVFCARTDTSAVVMSGSPNATNQALWTTKNVEVAIARWRDQSELSFLAAEPAVPASRTKSDEFRASPQLVIAWARYQGGVVRFKVVVISDEYPVSLFARVIGDAPTSETELSWGDYGEFAVPYLEFDPLQLKPARLEVRCQYEKGGREVTRAWISFDEFLDKSTQYRTALHALNRLLAGDLDHEADEDDAELLSAFAQEHGRVLGALSRPHLAAGSSGDADETNGGPVLPVPLQLLEAMASAASAIALQRSGNASGWVDQVVMAMRRAFEPVASSRAQSGHLRFAGALAPEEDGENYERKLPSRVRAALEAFEEELLFQARSVRFRPPNAEAVLQYTSLCVRVVLRYRAKETDTAPLWQSLASIVGAFLLPDSAYERGPLILLLKGDGQLDATALQSFAFMLALLAHQRTMTLGTVNQVAIEAGAIREALAVLDVAGGGPTLPAGFPDALAALEIDAEDIGRALADLRQREAPSERARLLKVDVLAVLGGGQAIDRKRVPIEESMLRTVARSGKRAPPLFVNPWVRQCPKCRQSFPTSLLPALARYEPLQCPGMGCARWLVPSEAV